MWRQSRQTPVCEHGIQKFLLCHKCADERCTCSSDEPGMCPSCESLLYVDNALEEIGYHAEQLATYIAQPTASAGDLSAARFHNLKILTLCRAEKSA